MNRCAQVQSSAGVIDALMTTRGGIQHSRINLRLPVRERNVRTRSFCLEWQKTPSRVLRLTLFNNNWLFSNKYFLFGLHSCKES